jgi:Domain of unknown function (DUF4190)/Domain of unknown function (DUF1707)
MALRTYDEAMSLDPPARPALRASDADREAVAERLRVASVDGRIDSEELEQRLAQVYAARWVGELDRIVADVVPPPPPAPPPPPVAAPYPYPQPYAGYQPAPSVNGLAVASLVASFFWVVWFGSFLAVVFGHIALSQIKQSGGRQTGYGVAMAGLVLGYIELSFLALWLVVYLA